MFDKLRKKKDEPLKWQIDCGYLPNKTKSGDTVKGKLVMMRDWKNSTIFFEPKNKTENKILLPIDSLKSEKITEKTKKMGLPYTEKYLKLSFTSNVNGIIDDHVFNLSNKNFDEQAFVVTKFLFEYRHPGFEYAVKTRGEFKKKFVNLYQPYFYDDEELLTENFKTNEKNQVLMITNFRIYHFDKKEKEVLEPVPLPVDVHSENVRRQIFSTTKGKSYGDATSVWGVTHTSDRKDEEFVVGDVVIFDDDGNEAKRIHIRDPDDIVKRIEIANKRFRKEEQMTFHQSMINVSGDINATITSNDDHSISQSVNDGNANIQSGDSNVNTQITFDVNEAKSIVDSIKATAGIAELPPETSSHLDGIMQIIQSQLDSEKPDVGIVKDMFNSVKHMLSASPTPAIFAGVLERISNFVSGF